jgi:hypothetical protein
MMMSPTMQMSAPPAPYTPTSDAMDRHEYGVTKNRKTASTGGGRAWSEDEVRADITGAIVLRLFAQACVVPKVPRLGFPDADGVCVSTCRKYICFRLDSRRCPTNT